MPCDCMYPLAHTEEGHKAKAHPDWKAPEIVSEAYQPKLGTTVPEEGMRCGCGGKCSLHGETGTCPCVKCFPVSEESYEASFRPWGV